MLRPLSIHTATQRPTLPTYTREAIVDALRPWMGADLASVIDWQAARLGAALALTNKGKTWDRAADLRSLDDAGDQVGEIISNHLQKGLAMAANGRHNGPDDRDNAHTQHAAQSGRK